jgi:hypothetical protein
MAATYAPNDAYTYCLTMVKDMPLADIKVQILDDAAKMIWHAAPWRWTIAAFPDVTVLANTADYTVSVPADFLYLQESFMIDEGNEGTPRMLEVVPAMSAGTVKGQPSEVSVSGTTLSLYPIQGAINTGSTLKVISTYKKACPKITSGNAATTGVLVMDDDWFWVYNSCVLYLAYLYADDQRAGGATLNSAGQFQFSGQRAVAEANIALMKDREKLPDDKGVRIMKEPKQK